MENQYQYRSETENVENTRSAQVEGTISAAILSSGIGCFVIGLMTTGAVLSESLKSFLAWSNPVGPLSGKTGIGVIAWLIAWAVFHNVFKHKEFKLKRIMVITFILIVAGFILTFPPVFEAFE